MFRLFSAAICVAGAYRIAKPHKKVKSKKHAAAIKKQVTNFFTKTGHSCHPECEDCDQDDHHVPPHPCDTVDAAAAFVAMLWDHGIAEYMEQELGMTAPTPPDVEPTMQCVCTSMDVNSWNPPDSGTCPPPGHDWEMFWLDPAAVSPEIQNAIQTCDAAVTGSGCFNTDYWESIFGDGSWMDEDDFGNEYMHEEDYFPCGEFSDHHDPHYDGPHFDDQGNYIGPDYDDQGNWINPNHDEQGNPYQ